MLKVILPPELEQRLVALSSKTKRSKSYYIRRAIEEFLEDEEDYLLAEVKRLVERLASLLGLCKQRD